MRFSDAFLRQVRDRVSIADYAGRKLTFDQRKSRAASGDYWACCPFHQEKSSSFHVLDNKGIYKCFGCGEKGDVFTLAMKLEGLSFPEAVAQMADRAGMALPTDEHEDRGEADRRKRLFSACTRAAKLYSDALHGREGANARAYLNSRGIGPDVWAAFGIGYAPDGWTWLIDKLKAENFSFDEIIEAGLAREGSEGKRPIDTFRDRVTFEIADAGGKVVAFGARALKKDEKAKYINSPETPLYHKGRTLYRLKQARELLAKTKANGLVVGEGYLDVIAFERAGIAAVAPCGTALTDDQLALLWRAGPEPVLCFDGDTAGKRAADRALDLALPHLGPNQTVKIALLPEGEDPDDLYRRAGPQALQPILDIAKPASDALFEREKNRRDLKTPEARAAFKTGLREAANKIVEEETRRLYFADLMARADEALRPPPRPPREPWQPRQGGGPGKGKNFQPPITAELKTKASLGGSALRSDRERFLRAAVDHPAILARFGDWVDRLELHDPELEAIRAGLHSISMDEESAKPIDRETLRLHLTHAGEERAVTRLSGWPKSRAADEGGDLAAEWLALVTQEVVLPAIKEELAELRERIETDPEAFPRAQALQREVLEIERRAREAKFDDVKPDDDASDDDRDMSDLVA